MVPAKYRGLCARCTQLLLISLLTVGNQISYDSIGAGEVYLKRELHLSAEEVRCGSPLCVSVSVCVHVLVCLCACHYFMSVIPSRFNALTLYTCARPQVGDLYSMYHLPNTFIVAIGGRLVDTMGAGPSAALFSSAVMLGSVIVAVGAHSASMATMSLGRVRVLVRSHVRARLTACVGVGVCVFLQIVLGVGGESMAVAQLALLSASFGHNNASGLFPTLALSFALALMMQRLGSLAAFILLPGQFELLGVGAFWVVVVITGAVLAVTVRSRCHGVCTTSLPLTAFVAAGWVRGGVHGGGWRHRPARAVAADVAVRSWVRRDAC